MAFNTEATLAVVSGMAFEAKIARAEGTVTLYGIDSKKLADDITQAAEKGLAGIISFGVAAGLVPTLGAGSIVIAQQVKTLSGSFTADAKWAAILAQQLPGAMLADIAGVDTPIASAAEKAALYDTFGAVAADMESHHAARIAQHFNIPFAGLRIVLDDAACTLPPAAFAATRPDGTINYGAIIASLIKNPFQLPAMIALGKKDRMAKAALLRCSNLIKHRRFGLMDLR